MVSTSPMETVLSYALVFAAGVASVFAIRAYGRRERQRGRLSVEQRAAQASSHLTA